MVDQETLKTCIEVVDKMTPRKTTKEMVYRDSHGRVCIAGALAMEFGCYEKIKYSYTKEKHTYIRPVELIELLGDTLVTEMSYIHCLYAGGHIKHDEMKERAKNFLEVFRGLLISQLKQ